MQYCNQDIFTGCNAAEIVFMLEYSRIDSNEDVDHEGDFIKELIDQYRVDEDHARIGVVVYHDTVTEAIHITDYKNDAVALKRRISELTRYRRTDQIELVPSGDADLAKAFDFITDNSFVGAREGVPRLVYALMHQMPTTEAGKAAIPIAAQRLKDACTTVVGVGIYSPSLNSTIAHQAVSEPWQTHYWETNTFYSLEEAAKSTKFVNYNCPTDGP